MIALLKPGGVFIPALPPCPYFLFMQYFDRAIIERLPYTAYPQTNYTAATSGMPSFNAILRRNPLRDNTKSKRLPLRSGCVW